MEKKTKPKPAYLDAIEDIVQHFYVGSLVDSCSSISLHLPPDLWPPTYPLWFTSAKKAQRLDASWNTQNKFCLPLRSTDVLTWRKCCRCAKGLVQREVTQGLEKLLLSALSEGLTSWATPWWRGRPMICLLLLSLAESSVINYNSQHHSPLCLCCEDQAVMQTEERSNLVCLQEDRRTPAGQPCRKPQTTLTISRSLLGPHFILFFVKTFSVLLWKYFLFASDNAALWK